MEVVRRLAFWKKNGKGAIGPTQMAGGPLGKVIYYEGTREAVILFCYVSILCTDIFLAPIGTFTHIYDSPSAQFPYPQCYKHDLALITGPNLPRCSQPPNCARVQNKFATPEEEALSTGTVFLLMSDFRRSKPGILEVVNGHAVSHVARDALILGVQTLWNHKERLEIANSLIWRSDPDDKS